MPSLENESRTVGTGELHRPIPNQLPIPTKESHGSAAKPLSAPLQARDPELHRQRPPQTVPVYAPKSPSPITQEGNIAVIAPNVHTPVLAVGQNQLGSPQHTPAQSILKASNNNAQSAPSRDRSKAQLSQYGQPSNVSRTVSGYGYDNTGHCPGPSNQPPSTREVFATYNLPQHTGGSQSATDPPHPGAGYQRTASTSAPQYKIDTQSRSGDQPHHYSQPQPRESPLPPQPIPSDYELNRKSTAGNERHESQHQQMPRPTQEYGSNPERDNVVGKERPGTQVRQKSLEYELKPEAASRQERPKRDMSQQNPNPAQPPLPHEEYQGEDEEDLHFQNRLQNLVDDEIHQEASEVMQQVSGGRRHIVTDRQRPFDPNLICPMCMKQFRIGEIQKFKHHVNTCDGTDDTII